MIAAELAQPLGLVEPSTSVLDAARRLVAEALPGLAVVSASGRPLAVLPASQVLGLAVPQYIKDDPSLAGVLDEESADLLVRRLAGLSVQDVLDDAEPDLLGTVAHDATLMELATEMSRLRVPLLVVTDEAGSALGTVTARAVLEAGVSRA